MLVRVAPLALWAVFVNACGGSQPHMEPEPPWVADYQKVATEGCECQSDPDCLEAAHAAAMKMEADHGGIDEMPPSVQTAHGDLDKCWREGTRDLGRDLSDAADLVCRCNTTECIEQFRLTVVQIETKYRFSSLELDTLDDVPRGHLKRAVSCIEGFTIPAQEYLEANQARAKRLCECDSLECWQTEVSAPAPTFGTRYYVAEAAAIQTDLDNARDKYCGCFHDVTTKMKDKVSPILITRINGEMHCGP